MWWGEFHGLMTVVVGLASLAGGHRESLRASVLLLAWWVNINILLEIGGDQIQWTLFSAIPFYIAAFVMAIRSGVGGGIHWFITVLFGLVIALALFMEGMDVGLFMSLRGGLFALMYLCVAASWRDGKWRTPIS